MQEVYTLKITGLTKQQNVEALVNALLKVPGLSSQRVSAGLKAPPFVVFSTKQEQEAKALRNTLEKFGAVCEIENSASPKASRETLATKTTLNAEADKNKYSWKFWVAIIAIMVSFILIERLSSISTSSTIQAPKQAKIVEKKAEKPAAKTARQKTGELKSDLSRNPYNTSAWKDLYENLEKQGDTASARRAKESYDKALRAQMVLSSLAKAFGNNARVDVAEEAVYYRTNKDLTDSEFYHEAEKLRESINVRFPNKDLVLENYTSDNRVQSIRLKPGYSTTVD